MLPHNFIEPGSDVKVGAGNTDSLPDTCSRRVDKPRLRLRVERIQLLANLVSRRHLHKHRHVARLVSGLRTEAEVEEKTGHLQVSVARVRDVTVREFERESCVAVAQSSCAILCYLLLCCD